MCLWAREGLLLDALACRYTTALQFSADIYSINNESTGNVLVGNPSRIVPSYVHTRIAKRTCHWFRPVVQPKIRRLFTIISSDTSLCCVNNTYYTNYLTH